MMGSALVSIIMPCYNAEAYIAQAIESVIGQAYTNWELLICDDCSIDNSREVIEAYVVKDERIHLYATSYNTGHPATPRNISLDHAQGDIVAFLDADDIWLPDMLKVNVEFMIRNNYDIVFSESEKMDCNGNRSNKVFHRKQIVRYNDMLKACAVPACITTIARMKVIGNTRFKSMHIEDYIFWLEVFKKGCVAYNTNTVQGLYRQTSNSRSKQKLLQFVRHWRVLRDLEKVDFVRACYYQMYYTIVSIIKFLK